MRKRCIGFDPATVSGWAYKTASGRWVNGTFYKGSISEALPGILSAAKAQGITQAVIEECFVRFGKKMNINTLKRLQDVQTRIRVQCEAYGIPVHPIYPKTWQAAWNLNGTRPIIKSGARKMAERLGAIIQKQDEADAVLICEYGNCQIWEK